MDRPVRSLLHRYRLVGFGHFWNRSRFLAPVHLCREFPLFLQRPSTAGPGRVDFGHRAGQCPTDHNVDQPDQRGGYQCACQFYPHRDSISQVQFFKGATSVGIVHTNISPYSVSVSNLSAGAYVFSAVATDTCGGNATNSIIITVNDLPAVSITNPTNGATFAAPLTNTIQVMATDGDGVRRVDFFTGQTPLG